MQKINPALYTPIAIVVAGIIIAAAVLVIGHQGNAAGAVATTGATPPSTTATVNAAQVSTTGDPIVGQANAPLTIVYWFDYQCPFCKQNEAVVIPQVLTNYVNAGKAKIVYKDFSFLGVDSDTLGHYARAVWAVAPDKFEAWHEAVYTNQGEENSGWATTAEIEKITASVLTPDQTAQVMKLGVTNATQYQSAMDTDKQEGTADGVQGTPAMLIGTQMVDGAESYAQVQAVINQELSAVSK